MVTSEEMPQTKNIIKDKTVPVCFLVCDKTMIKNNVGEMVQWVCYILQVSVHYQEKPRAGAEAETIEKIKLLIGSLAFHGCLSLLSYQPRTTCPGVPLSTVGRVIPHQLLIKKMLHRYVHRPSDCGSPSIVAPSFHMTPA